MSAKERNFGIDALRILSMFMVVVLHIFNAGGVLAASGRFTSQYEVGWFVQNAAFCAVDVYALISGYVWVNAKYRYRNIIELWLQVIFYTVSITVLFSIFSPSSVSFKEWIKALFPVMFNQYWYFSSYFALFLFIPLLNIVIQKAEKKQLIIYLGIVLFFFGVIQTLFFSDAFGTNDGYSAIWLIILYLVGGYLGKYGICKNVKPIKFLIGYLITVFLTWFSKLCIELLTLHVLGEVRAGNYFISYRSPFIFLAAIFLLLFFANLKISPFCKKVIGFLSPMAFGVYLIHTHPLVFFGIVKDRFTEYAAFPWILEILAVLSTAALIYIACSLIDFIRLQLFKILHIRQRLDIIEEHIKNKIRGAL